MSYLCSAEIRSAHVREGTDETGEKTSSGPFSFPHMHTSRANAERISALR